jgi:hypothetical protein
MNMDMIVVPLVRNWSWLFGMPKEGSTYYAIVQIVLWTLWGFIGVGLAVGVYPMIFKEPPARWMFITRFVAALRKRLPDLQGSAAVFDTFIDGARAQQG